MQGKRISPWGTRGLATLVALLAVACSDYSAAPPGNSTSLPVARVEVNPSAVTLGQGESATLVAKAFDASGYELPGRAMTWASRDSSIVGVDSSGRLLAKATGTAVVSVSIEGHDAATTVTVLNGPIVSIAVFPIAVVLNVGQSRQLTAFVFDAAGNRIADRLVVWSSDAPDVAVVSDAGLVSATGLGYATIIVTCAGKTFSLAVTVSEGE